MTQDLDALPLPEPTYHEGMYVFTEFDIYAARREGYELAMRKALEGREPVARLTRDQIDSIMTQHYPLDSLLRENVDAFEACVRDIEKALFSSPPPKSDEARDAWTLDQIADACVSAEISDSKFESLSLALATQQKGGAA